MASENLGQILFDAEVAADVGALRDLLASGQSSKAIACCRTETNGSTPRTGR